MVPQLSNILSTKKIENVLPEKTGYNKTLIVHQRLGPKQCQIQEQTENEIGAKKLHTA